MPLLTDFITAEERILGAPALILAVQASGQLTDEDLITIRDAMPAERQSDTYLIIVARANSRAHTAPRNEAFAPARLFPRSTPTDSADAAP